MSSTRQKTCNTERDGGLKKFLYDSESRNYVLIGDASEDELHGNLRRTLHSLSFSEEDEEGAPKEPIIPTEFRSERLLEEQNLLLYGRQCTCARTEDVYCPVGAYLCRIVEPNSWTYRIQCEGDAHGVAARFILPLVIFMYVFLTYLLVMSPKGKYARTYLRKVFCCWNEDRYQQELRQEIDRIAYRARRRRSRAQRPISNRVFDDPSNGNPRGRNIAATNDTPSTDEGSRPIAVGLKTRLYTTNSQETANECTICLTEFATGDRVGDLPCSHIFHIEPCLKKWIIRRNHCPLCQANNLATPMSKSAISLEQFTITDETGTTTDDVQSSETQQPVGQSTDELPSAINEREGGSQDGRPDSDSVIST